MSRWKAGLGVCAVAALSAAMLVAPGIVQAHKKNYPTSVTVQAQNKNLLEGQVHSVPRCLVRTIAVTSPAGALEATAVSDTTGKFKVLNKNLVPGVHTITVRRKVIRKNSHHKHVCLAATTTVTTT